MKSVWLLLLVLALLPACFTPCKARWLSADGASLPSFVQKELKDRTANAHQITHVASFCDGSDSKPCKQIVVLQDYEDPSPNMKDTFAPSPVNY